MHGTGHADDLVGLQMPGNKADAVPCERLPNLCLHPDESPLLLPITKRIVIHGFNLRAVENQL
jgi:hypothetical protein